MLKFDGLQIKERGIKFKTIYWYEAFTKRFHIKYKITLMCIFFFFSVIVNTVANDGPVSPARCLL